MCFACEKVAAGPGEGLSDPSIVNDLDAVRCGLHGFYTESGRGPGSLDRADFRWSFLEPPVATAPRVALRMSALQFLPFRATALELNESGSRLLLIRPFLLVGHFTIWTARSAGMSRCRTALRVGRAALITINGFAKARAYRLTDHRRGKAAQSNSN
jgi:hypothetical protein